MSEELNNAMVTPDFDYVGRDLNIFLLPDESGSMAGPRMATLNQAVLEATNELKTAAQQHPEADFKLRCIAFTDKSRWHIGPTPVDINDCSWQDLTAKGGTLAGPAVRMLAEAVTMDQMPKKGFPPVMVLLSDGFIGDNNAFEQAIKQLDQEPWGYKAIRISIGIGKNYDRKMLERFTNRPDIGVLEAQNTVDLTNYVKYAIVTASLSAANSVSDPSKSNSGNNVQVADAPEKATATSDQKLEVI